MKVSIRIAKEIPRHMGTVSHPVSAWAGNMSGIMLACFFTVEVMPTTTLPFLGYYIIVGMLSPLSR